MHEDGRVVPMKVAQLNAGAWGRNNHWLKTADGRRFPGGPGSHTCEWAHNGGDLPNAPGWRIRNVTQPTPQADTKPDLTARAPCMTISEVREMVAKGEDAVIATMLERGYALPEPVDEDLVEARKLAHGFVGELPRWQGILEGKHDSSPAITQLMAAIKRGRALALAGEKKA